MCPRAHTYVGSLQEDDTYCLAADFTAKLGAVRQERAMGVDGCRNTTNGLVRLYQQAQGGCVTVALISHSLHSLRTPRLEMQHPVEARRAHGHIDLAGDIQAAH